MTVSKRKPKTQEHPDKTEFPLVVKMGEIPKETLKENGYVWIASRKQWERKP